MQCISCGSDILSSFKHAMARNECPCCGGNIMDEESMALIEDVGRTILAEATVREDTAHKIALAIVAKYNLTLDLVRETVTTNTVSHNSLKSPFKVAPPSTMKKAMQQETGSEVVSPRIPEGISDLEREQIMENAVRKKYQMVDQLQVEAAEIFPESSFEGEEMPSVDSIFSEGARSPILEKERVARLTKQRMAIEGGGEGSFRRSG